MPKLLALFLFLCFSKISLAQDIMIFKKRNETIKNYFKGNTIAFLKKDTTWQKGEIVKILNDSFYIIPTIIIYNPTSIDTFRLPVVGYSAKDVYGLPKEGVNVDWSVRENSFQLSTSGGTVSGLWLKDGSIFKLAGAGYIGLNVLNGVNDGNYSFDENKQSLTTAAGLFGVGFLLGKMYKPYYKVKGKYRLVFIKT